jgi:long-chain acyl-CoA synthetase
VYIVDRLKDMIIVSGFNVYPAEVEQIIKSMPEVNEVAVIGIPDPAHGEMVKACIVKEPGANLTEAEVIKFCHDKLAAYKTPHAVEFYESLPKSPVGKILKRELRKQSEQAIAKKDSHEILG